MKITKTNMQILQKCLLNRTWPNYPNNFVCYAHISSLIPIINFVKNFQCHLLYNSFLFNNNYFLPCMQCILGTDKIHTAMIAKMECSFQECSAMARPDIMTANAKYNIWMRMYNKCSMKDTLNWQNFWQCDWRDLKY